MTSTALLGFLAVAVLAVLTPGLDTMLVLRHSLLGGRAAGLTTALGIGAGCALWGVASLAGLTALLTASQLAYDLVRLAGAAYLLWLGGSALWKSLRQRTGPQQDDAAPADTSITPKRALRSGTVTNLLNPKVGVFYISLLPQFLPAGPTAVSWGIGLVSCHVLITVLWLGAVVLLSGFARAAFQRPRFRTWLDRVSAGVLMSLGLALVAQGR